MAFNFGGFAGGLADGFNNGVRMGKTIRDVMKERKKDEFLKQAQEEAGAAWDAREAAKGGLPPQSDAPTSGPVDGEVPTAEKPAAAAPAPAAPEVPAGNPYDPGDTRTDPKPTQAASPETAATQLAPSVGTQTPAAPAAPEGEKVVQATPQQAVAAGGMPEADKPAAAAPAPAQPQQRQPADPATRSAFIQKEMGRRAYDFFVAQGDIDTAEKWLKHSETAAARAAMKDWAAAYTAPDFDTALKGFGKFYTDHVNDGVDYKAHEVITKEDGTQVGVITLRDRATGKDTKMELSRERMLQLAEANNPAALFKSETARAAEAAKIKAEAKAKADERKFKIDEMVYKEDRADQREGIKNQNQQATKRLEAELDSKKYSAQERSKLNLKIEALRAANFSDEQISGMMPRLVGADDYKKTTDPAERRALILSDLTKNDPTFARLPEAEQRKRVDQAMRVVGQDDGEAAPKGGKGGKPSGEAGAPMSPPSWAKEGQIVQRKQDGKKYVVKNGQMVPYEGSAAPAAPTAAPAPAAPAAAPAPAAPAPATPARAAAGGLPPAPAPAPAPVAAPAPAPQQRSLEQVLNPGGNPETAKVMAPRAAQIRSVAAELAQLEQATRQAAASGDQRAVVQAAQAQQAARSKMEALMKDMNPEMRKAVMAALAQ